MKAFSLENQNLLPNLHKKYKCGSSHVMHPDECCRKKSGKDEFKFASQSNSQTESTLLPWSSES
jgi:hypothetical protein